MVGSRELAEAAVLLETLPDLDGATADGLIRAARGYADAVWVAEADPEFACIKLVGALETAALAYAGGSGTPTDRLRVAMPGVAADLEAAGGAAHLDAMARSLADLVRSSARFLEFCETFAPPPPTKRPPSSYQIEWDRLRDQLRLVYEARSKYLHAGEPVPEPICAVPELEPGWDAAAEIVPFKAVSINGRTWEKPNLPMYLSTLEALTREVLLNWWRSP
jgi:hypothetical protein